MGEYIIFRQDDGKLDLYHSSGYDGESLLQGLIREYPTLLSSISPGKIYTLVDEYPTDIGNIDVLCVDGDGRISTEFKNQ
jgi:RecB family endonuclease NucS